MQMGSPHSGVNDLVDGSLAVIWGEIFGIWCGQFVVAVFYGSTRSKTKEVAIPLPFVTGLGHYLVGRNKG